MGKDRAGGAGEDVVIKVPIGTQVIDADNGEILIDLTEDGQTALLAKGGNGGWGNARFKSSTNQAPRKANPGEESEERWIWLRLKLLADAGLVGLPNAGKSTFLSTVTAAKPKTADYPFTTLHPHLGVVNLGATERFVLADLPGLIEGASEGAGLGHRFLGHVERCAAVLHLVDASAADPIGNYQKIRKELIDYDGGIDDKPEIVIITKCDALDADTIELVRSELGAVCGVAPLAISSVAQQGLNPVLSAVFQHVQARRQKEEGARADKIKRAAIQRGEIEDIKGWQP